MILKSIKISSQNIHKNQFLTDTLLENYKDFNIFFIQEPPSLSFGTSYALHIKKVKKF